ncbi:MAG TPA: urea transporter [Calditrichia bacterium]|nr:urea transporter [Calditrichota bacterium]HQU70781.1 urea transporter [Calditrichia bacterium]HQV30849.1 urea transporter [Calditrichia bacterium]
MNQHLKAIFNSYSEVFFLKGLWTGGLLLAITFLNPNVAVAGIVAVVAAYLFANFIEMDREFLKSGFYTYNPLLVGLSIGYLFRITPLTLFLVIIAGIFTFALTHMLYSIFSYYFLMPILSLPFVMVSSVAYLAASQYTNLFVTALYPAWYSSLEMLIPIWISGLLKSLGAILFMPDVIAGTLLLTVIVFSSRILFFLVLTGYYGGTAISALMRGSWPQAFADVNHFNFIWIAIAVGGIFLVPSIRSYVLAMVAVATSTILLQASEVFWSEYGIPAFALPFNIVSMTFIYVLGIVRYPLMTRVMKGTPEDTLDHFLATTNRFPGEERTLQLPFSGKWTVWQGFDGQWTHQGSWRYAYDFVITDEQGSTFREDGSLPEHYYAFRKPVLSPVRGRVVTVVDSLPDNPIGEVDRTNNWGNMLIISDPRGFFVEISHFVHQSIKVKEGDWVERGSFLGLCGNSGYSPQPHIHLQVQVSEEPGAITQPFSFVSYLHGQQFQANNLPAEGEIVEPLLPDKGLSLKMMFILDQTYRYQVLEAGQLVAELHLTVRMAPDGTFYFDSGKGRLYFGSREGTFYFYAMEGSDPWLKAMFIALPRLPLAFREELSWSDYIPVGMVSRGLKKALTLFLASFSHRLDMIHTRHTHLSRGVIEGTIHAPFLRYQAQSRVELDEAVGIARVRLNDFELRRIIQ